MLLRDAWRGKRERERQREEEKRECSDRWNFIFPYGRSSSDTNIVGTYIHACGCILCKPLPGRHSRSICPRMRNVRRSSHITHGLRSSTSLYHTMACDREACIEMWDSMWDSNIRNCVVRDLRLRRKIAMSFKYRNVWRTRNMRRTARLIF